MRRSLEKNEIEISIQLIELFGNIVCSTDGHATIRFDTFQSAFFRGDILERVSAILDWNAVEKTIADGNAKIDLVPQWSVDWLN